MYIQYDTFNFECVPGSEFYILYAILYCIDIGIVFNKLFERAEY